MSKDTAKKIEDLVKDQKEEQDILKEEEEADEEDEAKNNAKVEIENGEVATNAQEKKVATEIKPIAPVPVVKKAVIAPPKPVVVPVKTEEAATDEVDDVD